jgi:hypothetical protein
MELFVVSWLALSLGQKQAWLALSLGQKQAMHKTTVHCGSRARAPVSFEDAATGPSNNPVQKFLT